MLYEVITLPLADGAAAAGRGRTLWPLQPGGGEHVRPPLPVGLEADRAGPGPGRRALFGRVACGPLREPAGDGAGVRNNFV